MNDHLQELCFCGIIIILYKKKHYNSRNDRFGGQIDWEKDVMWVSYYREPKIPNNNFYNGDVPLQVNCTGCNRFEDKIHASSVRKDYYLFYLHSGEMRLIEPKNSDSVIHAGDLIVYEPNKPFCYETNGKPPTSHYFVHFTGFSAYDLLLQCQIPLNSICHIRNPECILEKLHALFATFQFRDAFFDPDSAQKLTDLLVFIGRDLTNINTRCTREIPEQMKRSLTFLQEHFTEELTVTQLSSMEFLSPSRYRTIFRGVMQQSPQEYIIHLRLNMACSLLSNTKHSISEVAQAVGYADPRYFARLFRKMYGMTPTEYRNGGTVSEKP